MRSARQRCFQGRMSRIGLFVPAMTENGSARPKLRLLDPIPQKAKAVRRYERPSAVISIALFRFRRATPFGPVYDAVGAAASSPRTPRGRRPGSTRDSRRRCGVEALSAAPRRRPFGPSHIRSTGLSFSQPFLLAAPIFEGATLVPNASALIRSEVTPCTTKPCTTSVLTTHGPVLCQIPLGWQFLPAELTVSCRFLRTNTLLLSSVPYTCLPAASIIQRFVVRRC